VTSSRVRHIVLGLLVAASWIGVPAARADEGAQPMVAPPASAQAADPGDRPNMPTELLDVGVDEKLDAAIPPDATFRDQDGKMVRFGDFVDGKRPTLLIFAYHSCPVLCSMIQNGVVEALQGVPWTVGKDFNAVTISIDPRDTPAIAADKRRQVLEKYGRPEAQSAWPYLVGDAENIGRATKAAGWRFAFDSRQGQYAHPSAVILLKPNGRVARYLYGLSFESNDVRLGLLEASEGKSISTVERLILYCYHYDPQERKYTIVATRVMQLGGVVTVLALGTFLGALWLRERTRRKPDGEDNDSSSPDVAARREGAATHP
jgi:protein SCO1/2